MLEERGAHAWPRVGHRRQSHRVRGVRWWWLLLVIERGPARIKSCIGSGRVVAAVIMGQLLPEKMRLENTRNKGVIATTIPKFTPYIFLNFSVIMT